MHLYIITRGCKHEVDRFVNELSAKYLPYEYDNTKPKGVVQVGVRPIQLYEIAFPEEHLEKMLATIKPSLFHKWEAKFMFVLRKILKSKPIPKISDDVLPMPIYKDNIEIAGIGIKKDAYKDGIEQI